MTLKKTVLILLAAALLIPALCVGSSAANLSASAFGSRLVMRADAADTMIDQSPKDEPSPESERIGVIIVISIILIVGGAVATYFVLKHKKAETRHVAPRRSRKEDNSTSVTELRPVKEYHKTIDPAFNEKEFKKLVSDLYLRIQDCRMKRDFTELRPYLASDVYGYFEKKCADQMEQKRTPVVENINVESVDVTGYKRGVAHDHMKVKIAVSIIEYLKSDRSGRVVSGSRTDAQKKKYEWDMRRRRDDIENPEAISLPESERVWKLDSIKSLVRNTPSR